MRTGWKLNRIDRGQLLERFPPLWPDVVADHVTSGSSKRSSGDVPDAVRAFVVGHVDDRAGLQALVVEIDGTTIRPDGSTYHITWSIDRKAGRQPKDSNEVIARLGWQELAAPLPIRLIPGEWE